jgi:DNA polymerase (family X)
MQLLAAIKLAERIKSELAPLCEKIEIVGSIRRARPEVNDIDLVILPRDIRELRYRLFLRTTPVSDGPQTIITRLSNGPQLDIWLARPRHVDLIDTTPSNWGSLMLSRTGSKEHNIWLCEQATAMDLHWNPHVGIVDVTGKVLASETEDEIYAFLGIDVIPPAFREVEWLRRNFSQMFAEDKSPKKPEPRPAPASAEAIKSGFAAAREAIQ